MRKIILIMLIISSLISGHRVVTTITEYNQSRDYYDSMQNEYVQEVTPSPIPVVAHTTTQQPPIAVDFYSLKQINNDVIGWIYCENTPINYPIMHTSNNIYYLTHLLDRSYSANGCIFLDCINNEFNDANSILYGHHMRDGSMFASISGYKEQNYYDEHPVLWLLTQKQNYMLCPFAGLIVEPDRENYFMNSFDSAAEQQEYIKYALENSTFIGDFSPNEKDRIITLATCDYTFKDARFILVCTLVKVT